MSCKPVCRLCNRLVFSQSIEFTGGNLVVNLPAGSYENGEKYCVVFSQTIPETTTIVAPVVFTIGSGTTQYPLTNKQYIIKPYNPCGSKRFLYDISLFPPPFPPPIDLVPSNKAIPLWSVELSLWV